DRGADPPRPARGDEGPDDDHHRAPAVDDLARRRADRARQRTRRRAGHRRGTASHERGLPRHPRARTARGGVRAPRGGDRRGGYGMRVWQPGGHLTRNREAVKIDDWSWQRTVRRVTTLAKLAAPYKRQTTLAIITLFAATATALAPPYLAKLAIDDGIAKDDLHALTVIVALFLLVGVLNLGTNAAQTYFTGWTGERILADLRNTLFRHLQRLSLGFYERNRAGVIISRLTNDVEALDQLVTDGVTTLVQSTLFLFGTSIILFVLDCRLALATLTVLPLMAVATAIVLGYGGYLVFGGNLTVGTLFAFVLYLSNFFDPVQQLSQLYNTFLAAVAALDKIMDVMDEEPEVRDKPGARDLSRIDGHV